jgi:exosortase A-associated hydrolase 1
MDRNMRTPLSFPLDGLNLAATLDPAPGRTGLLIVTGGTQVRIGPHRSLALLAAATAARGFPVFRFDRRGTGDSEGEDPGFARSGPDIGAAVAAFRRECPQLQHIAGFGLCDGATALALHHREAGIDALLLANPWVVEPQAGLPPPSAIRRHYIERLTTRRGWSHLLRGFDWKKAARGMSAAAKPASNGLADQVGHALALSRVPVRILLAGQDATAIAFEAEYRKRPFAPLRDAGRASIAMLDSGSHSFASRDEAEWLERAVIEALEELDAA